MRKWWKRGKRQGVCVTLPSLRPVPLTSRAISDFLSGRKASDEAARQTAAKVIAAVRAAGFAALSAYSEKFDGLTLTRENAFATSEEMREAERVLLPSQRRAMLLMKRKIERFALLQKASMGKVSLKGSEGATSLRFVPVERVGIYVPAGRAPLLSSLFMSAVPARIAGVKEMVVCTPPQKDGRANPLILAAARMCGIEKVCKIGGAQAIAAMAFGAEGLMLPSEVICGPGNAYVSAAKQLVASYGVRIDVPAGPSEVLIIAGKRASPAFVAADMLAQAEHGGDSAALCICTSIALAKKVADEIARQLALLPDGSPARQSIPKWGRIFVTKSMQDAFEAADMLAPEHLEIFGKDAQKLAGTAKNAGAVFVETAEAFCDYGMSGGNHILPTNSAARAWGGVSVQTFGKWMYEETLTGKAQAKLSDACARLARMEGLEAHARAAELRKGKEGRK